MFCVGPSAAGWVGLASSVWRVGGQAAGLDWKLLTAEPLAITGPQQIIAGSLGPILHQSPAAKWSRQGGWASPSSYPLCLSVVATPEQPALVSPERACDAVLIDLWVIA